MSRVSIQSKLLVMLLLTSILSAAVVGAIGYQSGRNSLRASVFDRLTEIRQSQSSAAADQVADLKNSLVIYSRGSTATRGHRGIHGGLRPTRHGAGHSGSAAVDRRLLHQAVRQGRERADRQGRRRRRAAADVNRTAVPAGQLHRAVHRLERAIKFDDARDGSAWSAANARFNDFFREIVKRFEFEDALLLDTRGNVVYTAYKGVDLGTNVLDRAIQGERAHERVQGGAGLQRGRLRRRHGLRRLSARR